MSPSTRPSIHRAAALILVIVVAVLATWSTPATAAPATDRPAGARSSTPAAAAATTRDEPSAAERRSSGSSYERERLDPSAFAPSRKEAKPAASGASSVGRMLFGLVVVVVVILGVNMLLKKWGQSRLQGAAGSAGIIDVVATTTLAPSRSLHLVRVGGEMVLVGATEHSITQLGRVDSDVIAAAESGAGPFQSMLRGALVTSQPSLPQGAGSAGGQQTTLLGRVIGNIQMLTAR